MFYPIVSGLLIIFVLVFDIKNKVGLSGLFKTAASLTLLAFTISLTIHQSSSYSYWLLSAIIAGVIGDILLAIKNTKAFIAGMLAFLIGHIFYLMGFRYFEFEWLELLAGLGILLVAMGFVYNWIKPALKGPLKPGVAMYMLALATMTASAVAVRVNHEHTVLALGAILFLFSDFFVAVNRFKKSHIANRLLGLPLYYAGQYTLAYSIIVLME